MLTRLVSWEAQVGGSPEVGCGVTIRGVHVDAPALDQAILLHGRDSKQALRHVTSDQVAPHVYGFRIG